MVDCGLLEAGIRLPARGIGAVARREAFPSEAFNDP